MIKINILNKMISKYEEEIQKLLTHLGLKNIEEFEAKRILLIRSKSYSVIKNISRIELIQKHLKELR